MMMMMMMMMTLMKLVNSGTKFRPGIDKFFQPNYFGLCAVPRPRTRLYIYIYTHTWWLIPLAKWVVTLVVGRLTLIIPPITRDITCLVSGMSHQIYSDIINIAIYIYRWLICYMYLYIYSDIPTRV